MKPTPCKGHLPVSLSMDRILILKRDSPSDDCILFLEVDTPFVKAQKKILGTEVVAWSKGVLGDGAMPIVISGPSGVGKGTLISRVTKEFPSAFGFSVSHTTCSPRTKEVDGIHYHFTKRSTMENDIRDGKFLEYASVHGNLYGTSTEAVTSAGKGNRDGGAGPKEIVNARAELEQGMSPGLFDHLLVNDDLESCYQDLKKILALYEVNDTSYQPSMMTSEVQFWLSVSKRDKKILLHCENNELGAYPSLLELDISSLKGGAPGRTRGLNIYSVDS